MTHMDTMSLVFMGLLILTTLLNMAVIFEMIYDIVMARYKRKCPHISIALKFGTPRSRG